MDHWLLQTKANQNNEKSFLTGSEPLNRMFTVSVDSGSEIKSRLFKLWFEFLIKSDQTIMSFHSCIHRGIIFEFEFFHVRFFLILNLNFILFYFLVILAMVVEDSIFNQNIFTK